MDKQGRWSALAVAFVLVFCAAGLARDEAAPAKTIQGWGKVIDPRGDCAVAERDGSLSMTVAGRHDLSIELPQPMDAPRVLRDIEGDFIAIVNVGGAFQPTAPSTVPTRRPYVGAGLLFWLGENDYVRLERASVDVDGQTFEYLAFEQRKNGMTSVACSQIGLKNEPVWIRLERRNGKLYGAASYDAQQWIGYPPIEIVAGKKAQVGIAAISSSSLPFMPEFSGLEIYRRQTDDDR